MKLLRLFIVALLYALPGASFSTAHGEAVKAVATYSILGDIVQNVGGEHLDLTVLVGPDSDSHTFEPAPSDAVTLAEAQVIFENGLEFESWLDDLYTASGSSAERVEVSRGVVPLEFAEHDEEHADEAGEEHEHGEFDPHIWHSVTNAIKMTENVRDALISIDPDHADEYIANAEAYIARLTELDTFIRDEVAALLEERRKIVTTHDTFSYFASDYGFEILGTALAAATTEAADPSAADIASLVREIQEAGVPAIFADNITNPDLMTQIAENAGVTLAPALYTDALGQPGTPGDTYINLMRYNVTTIVAALEQ
jgi:ABC-type Zn uptake system ZnuABC Zn-binding protein ZnuA